MNALPSTFIYRKLWPVDRDCFVEHLLRLDRADRQMRFCGSVSDHGVRSYGSRIDWLKTTIFACFAGGKMLGAAELIVTKEAMPVSAELALTVEAPFQDRGIGSELLRKTLVLARNRFVGTVHMYCLLENKKMQHIARKFDANLTLHQGEAEGRISPNWPSYYSLVDEALTDGQAFFRAAFETAGRG